MNLKNMKFFNTAPLSLLCCTVIVTKDSQAADGDFDLERINASFGRTFYDILILGADSHGLTFRHREGIAKVEFASLPENLRMLYEATGDVPGSGDPGQNAPAAEPAPSVDPVLTVYHRLTVSFPTRPWAASRFCSSGIAWSSSSPGYRSPHLLTIPCYRERATRDFLLLSGLSGLRCPDWSGFSFGRGGHLHLRQGF